MIRSKLSFSVLDFRAWVLWCCFFQFKADINSVWDLTFLIKINKSIWSEFSIRCFSTTFWICCAQVMRYWRWSSWTGELKSLQEAWYMFSDLNLTKEPSHNTTPEQWWRHRFEGDVRGWDFLRWWPCCLFCASEIKGRHCWNEKQMLARNSPDCSTFFHAWASNAASVHRSPPYFLSFSPSLLCTLFTFWFFLSSFQL